MALSPSVNIYDCFTFSEERLLLEERIKYLSGVVDVFVIVEARLTHQGDPRDLVFPTMQSRLTRYKSQILYIVVDDFPVGDAWGRENNQRNAILQGLASAKGDDLVIVSDVDEIPNRDVLIELKALGATTPFALEMRFSFYSLNLCSESWYHAKITPYRLLKSPQQLREARGLPTLRSAGWHMSYLGTVEDIQRKLQSFAHTEYASGLWTSRKHIQRCMRLGVRVFGGQRFTVVADNLTFPGITRASHPELFQDRLSRLQGLWSRAYLIATNYRHRIPQRVSDNLPVLAVLMALPFAAAAFLHRGLRRVRRAVRHLAKHQPFRLHS